MEGKTEEVFFWGEFFNPKVQVFPVISYKNLPLGLYVIAGNPFCLDVGFL